MGLKEQCVLCFDPHACLPPWARWDGHRYQQLRLRSAGCWDQQAAMGSGKICPEVWPESHPPPLVCSLLPQKTLVVRWLFRFARTATKTKQDIILKNCFGVRCHCYGRGIGTLCDMSKHTFHEKWGKQKKLIFGIFRTFKSLLLSQLNLMSDESKFQPSTTFPPKKVNFKRYKNTNATF